MEVNNIRRSSTMLVGKRDMDYITRDVDFRGRLIKYCEMVIDYGKWLQNGNFPHGMSGLRYYLKYINTIMLYWVTIYPWVGIRDTLRYRNLKRSLMTA
jgi:hypothetical protein